MNDSMAAARENEIATEASSLNLARVDHAVKVAAVTARRGSEQALKSAAHQIGAAESASESDLRRRFFGLLQQTPRRFYPKLQQVARRYSRGAGYVPSPILYGDFLYVMNDHGLLTCLDARTGNPVYEGRRPPGPGDYLASPVAFAGKIFITNTEGDTFVIQAGREHGVLRKNSLGEPVYASFALAAGSIFIRAERHLYRIGGPRRRRTELNCADAGWAL